MKILKKYLEEIQKEQASIASGSIAPPDVLQDAPEKKQNIMVDDDNLTDDVDDNRQCK